MATFTYVARYQHHGSTELATPLALTTGAAVVGLTYGSNDTFTGHHVNKAASTWPSKVVEIGDVDGIVTVASGQFLRPANRSTTARTASSVP